MNFSNKRIKTTRVAPERINGKDYIFPAFSNGMTFEGKKNGRLPAMGWNSWNAFGSGNTEALTKAMADKIVELGLDKLGYSYVVLDDGCYFPERVDGRLTNESVKFPSGFRALADYIHGKGLKFGMYNDVGTNLCAGSAVGTCGYEDVDALSYADWDIDYLKVDNCYYLWDNASFSNPENARYTYAPRIKSIEIVGDRYHRTLNAVDGKLVGRGGAIDADGAAYNIGTIDGHNVGPSPVGDIYSELVFEIPTVTSGYYDIYVTYASGREAGIGQWLQVAVGELTSESEFYDELLPETPDKNTFVKSEAISVTLFKGTNKIRLMNHRRQENTLNAYAAMFYALQAAKPDNDIILSLCEWGKTQPQSWGYKVGNSWRILNDITYTLGTDGTNGTGSWNHPGTQSIASQYNKAVVMDEFAGLNRGWNDPDMMVIGMDELTETMYRTHMVMWCMMNSPLMLGLDLRRVEKGDMIHKIIANKELIALNQDPLGIQAKRVYSTLEPEKPDTTYLTNNERVDILAKPLANGDLALSFINLSTEAAEGVSITMDRILELVGLKCVNAEALRAADAFILKDLITGEEHRVDGREFAADGLAGCDQKTYRVRIAE